MAEKNLDLALRIRADLKAAVGEVNSLGKELGQLDTQGKKASSGVKATASAVDLATVKFGRMTPVIEKAQNNLRQFNATANQLRSTLPGIVPAGFAKGIKDQGDQMHYGSITAGQYKQAMRQLPAQITDITTSLASGMPIWLVAIQQGGQIRDSFGSTSLAAKALLSTIKPIPVLYASVAAAVVALAVAYQQGQGESEKFNNALILSGNASGTSADHLADMAQRLDDIGGTRREAAAALTEIAQTGAFTEQQIERIGQAAVQMQIATGQAVKATVDEFVKLSENPVEAISKLDDQYHFLDAAIYSNIKSLQDQGKEVEAIELAINTYADTMQQRAQEVAGNLGILERGWKAIKNAASEGWDAMLNIGRQDTLEQQLQDVNKQIAAQEAIIRAQQKRNERRSTPISVLDPDLVAERERLQLAIQVRDEQAAAAGEKAKDNAAAKTAIDEIDRLTKSNLTTEEKRVAAIKEYKDNLEALRKVNPNDERLNPDTVAKNIAAINARYADKDAEKAAEKAKRQAEQLAESQKQYVEQLERTAATVGKTAVEVRAYDLAEQHLSGTLRDRANAALVAIQKQEELNQKMADAKQLATIQARILDVSGDPVAARRIELEQQYSELRNRLVQRGDEAGTAFVDKLINLELARTRLGQVQEALSQILAEQQRVEDSINVQSEAGLINEVEARQKILDLHKQTAQVLLQQRPILQELAQQPGEVGQAAAAALAQLDTESQRLLFTTSKLDATLKQGISQGLTSAISGLAQGTLGLKDAIGQLIGSIGQALLQLAAQQAALAIVGGSGGSGGILALLGYADGGYTGDGGKYQPAGVVHAGEYVQPQAVMRQPGALQFMESFRQYGMSALSRFPGYAEGGLVTPSAASLPSVASGLGGSGGVEQLNQFISLDPLELADSIAATPNFSRSIFTVIRSGKHELRAILNGGK